LNCKSLSTSVGDRFVNIPILGNPLQNVCSNIPSDQKENKSDQALQIIGHVVAESYAMHGRRQFVVSNATLQ
jgi:hypothetical protein